MLLLKRPSNTFVKIISILVHHLLIQQIDKILKNQFNNNRQDPERSIITFDLEKKNKFEGNNGGQEKPEDLGQLFVKKKISIRVGGDFLSGFLKIYEELFGS